MFKWFKCVKGTNLILCISHQGKGISILAMENLRNFSAEASSQDFFIADVEEF